MYLVPSEIEARGPRAKLAYENALKTGKVKVYRARIMLIGQDRAGKTSLKKSFLRIPFDPEEESTDGIEVDPLKFEVDTVQVKNWKRTDEKFGVSQFASDLAKIVAEKLQGIGDESEEEDEKKNDEENEVEEKREPGVRQVNRPFLKNMCKISLLAEVPHCESKIWNERDLCRPRCGFYHACVAISLTTSRICRYSSEIAVDK